GPAPDRRKNPGAQDPAGNVPVVSWVGTAKTGGQCSAQLAGWQFAPRHHYSASAPGRRLFASAFRSVRRPWKKCPQSGKRISSGASGEVATKRCTAAASTTSSSSPCTTVTGQPVSLIEARSKLVTGGATSSRCIAGVPLACNISAPRAATNEPKEKPASHSGRSGNCACNQCSAATRSSVSPSPSL